MSTFHVADVADQVLSHDEPFLSSFWNLGTLGGKSSDSDP